MLGIRPPRVKRSASGPSDRVSGFSVQGRRFTRRPDQRDLSPPFPPYEKSESGSLSVSESTAIPTPIPIRPNIICQMSRLDPARSLASAIDMPRVSHSPMSFSLCKRRWSAFVNPPRVHDKQDPLGCHFKCHAFCTVPRMQHLWSSCASPPLSETAGRDGGLDPDDTASPVVDTWL